MDPDVTWAAVVIPIAITSPLMLGAGLLLKELARRGADGRLERNRVAGVRTSATLASDEAWLVGHVAAEPDSIRAGDAALAAAVAAPAVAGVSALVGLVGPGGFIAVWTTLLLVGVVVMIGFAVRGVRAANAAVASIGAN